MFSQVSYNVVVERFKAFADGHYLIKRFSHGQIDVTDIMKDAEYPWMHIVPVSMNPSAGTRSFSFDIIFADLPRDKEEKTEYQRESLSDCIRLAEDLLAEIQNGYVIFGQDVELEDGATISPFMEEYTHVLTGVTLSLTMTFPWDWNACDIPADWSTGGSGSGGTGGGGASLILKVNNVDNAIQTILNITAGANMTITDLGDGRVKFDATGDLGTNWGTIGGLLADQLDLQSALDLKADISSLADVAFSGDYGDLINTPTIPDVLGDLSDVDTTGQVFKNVLYYNGTQWIPYMLAAVAYSGSYADLSNQPEIPKTLKDLIGNGVKVGDIIQWDGTTWVVQSPSWSLEKLSDVNVVGVTAGQVLTWDAATSKWIPTTPSFTQVQSDWNQTDSGQVDFIKNKPTLPSTIGDMTKAVYDTDNDGIVDFAEALKTEVRNSTGAILRKGYIVYLSGSTGNLPNAVPALANSDATSAQTFGVVYEDIANNSDGYVVTLGQINTLDTRTTAAHPFTSDTLVDGDVIYLSPTTAGWVTRVKPSAPQHIVYVGMVVRTSPTNGTIQYRIQNGYELDELHDVVATTPVNNDYLYYDSSTSLYRLRQLTAARITDSTTVGQNLVTLPNPSAIRYLRINADNTISAITTAELKSAVVDTIGYGSSFIASVAPSTTTFGSITSGNIAFNTNESNRQFTIPFGGTVRDLYLHTSTAQGSAGSLVVSISKNLVNQSLSITVPANGLAGTRSDTTNTFTVVAGDKLTIRLQNNHTNVSATIVSVSFIIERI